MIEFPFIERDLGFLGKALYPVIPVSIVGPKMIRKSFMYLDSGADISLIPYSVGKAIGLRIDEKNIHELGGIGNGSISYVLSEVKFRLEEIEFEARIGWALIEEVPFILGRLDVFSRFSIEFREFENRILIRQPDER